MLAANKRYKEKHFKSENILARKTQNDPIGNYFWEYLNISQRAFKDSLMQYHEKKEICLE